ncbi:hypothetical protein HY087_00985 [Candidatus Gottesmanbacteria bacterium]|nr:hypothetical protein [Candidatus Gottesmanbacteria bacterium]MBI3559688.1 hypothetical protein [Candidatus Gottesmanbacteria bacterium]
MIARFVRLGIRLLPLVAILLLVMEILVTNELVGFGKKVAEEDRAIDVLREENQLIQEKVASLSSLLTIEVKARDLGFTTSPNIVTIGTQDVAFHLQP